MAFWGVKKTVSGIDMASGRHGRLYGTEQTFTFSPDALKTHSLLILLTQNKPLTAGKLWDSKFKLCTSNNNKMIVMRFI